MSDYASQIGGSGDTVPIGSADPDGAYAYFWSSGNTSLNLGESSDAFDGTGSTGNVTVFGGDGNDTLVSGSGNDALSGGAGNDLIDAGSSLGGNNTVSGGAGDDQIYSGNGNDVLAGDIGDDTIEAGGGSDRVFGQDGDDSIAGEAGNDSLYGQEGDDTLLGGLGQDSLSGGAGDDFLDGGAGNDTMYGGEGSDVFFFDSNFGNDIIKDFGTGDEIWLKAGLNGSGIGSANDLVSQGHISGGVDPATSQPFTTITIGSDTIRIDGIDSSTFSANVSSWVKVQP